MREAEDLRRVFTDHEESVGDVGGLLEGIHGGIASRGVRRRRAGIAAAALATALLVVVPVVATALTQEVPVTDRPSVLSSPLTQIPLTPSPLTPSPSTPASPPGPSLTPSPPSESAPTETRYEPAVLAFSVNVSPGDVTGTWQETGPGSQSQSYVTAGSDVLVVHRFDPVLSGVPAPITSGEIATAGDRDVEVLAGDPRGIGSYAVGWEPGPGEWLTVSSSADPATARAEVLATAAAVDTEQSEILTTPVQLSYLPPALAVAGVNRAQSAAAAGDLTSTLWYADGTGTLARSLIVYAEHNPPDDGTAVPDSTVDGYPEQYSLGSDGQQDLTLYDVEGFRINLHVPPELSELIPESVLRRVAAGLSVVPDGADIENWSWVPQA
ncbi:MAG: hypothetical protein H0V10_11815 [Geodermatophilaceae bacterium]|nr:hypothetical protein [Geodermatophilaceae bacterium]